MRPEENTIYYLRSRTFRVEPFREMRFIWLLLAPAPEWRYAIQVLRVVTLSTLFPNAWQPTLGVFVENQTLRLAACSEVALRVLSPLAVPFYPFSRLRRYHGLRDLPLEEDWKGVCVARPRLRTVPRLSGPINPWLLVHAALPVLQRWREEGFAFDVIDAEFFWPDGPAAARLSEMLGVPFSIKARGADIHYWAFRPGCRRKILDAAARADGLLAVSQSLRRDMIAIGMEAAKIRVHYTGVDLNLFSPIDGREAPGPVVVSLGALIPRKGHDIIINAMADLPDATLLVVGDGPERERLSERARTLGLADRVRFLGNLRHTELPAILAAADVMALASASEGLANAWIEAMACGTPVVTTDVDGAWEAVDRPAAGRLVRERTPAAFAEAIRAILADPPPREAVRASAERFTWEKNTRTLIQHLSAIRGRSG